MQKQVTATVHSKNTKTLRDFHDLRSQKLSFQEYLESGARILNDEHGKTTLREMMEVI
jgi:hypothetical protein